MGRIKAHRKTELPVRPPAESSVVSVTSPYFDAENTTDEIETNRKRRRSGCVSVRISQVTDKPEIDNDLGENCSGKMLCTKSRSVSIKHKKPVASELPPSRGYHCDKKKPVRSKMSDLSAESLLNQKEEDEPSDIHHRLPSKRSCVQSGAESKITRKPVHSGKRPVRCTEVDHKQCEEEVRVNSESVVSSSHVVQRQENLDSSHSLEINKPPRSKKRRRGNLLLFSEFPHDSPSNKTTSSSPVLQNSHLDESDEADWEEVNEEAVGEVDIMQTLLGVRSKAEAADADKQTDDEPLTSVREFDPPRYYLLAEVFLPKLNRWICIDFHKPLGLVDKIPKHPSMFYVIGMTTTFSDSLDTQPYIGRNPIDLASRYDPDWCIQSRLYRLPADRWSVLLQFQRLYFDKDAAQNNSLIARTGSLSTELRDRADEDSIRSGLLVKPMPEKVQDFKNHPLYILPRHLLKFEVIHPPDALPLGFFRGEPIYSRDCLHLCHTRESWLREAKVVKDFEQPAKVVKARPSLKRKLLQGSDPTPPMVEIFGSWQVEDYQPPVAKDGVVPRNIHGTIDLFKPCMLPVGCAHICLTGIQHVAKKLGIDCAPAVSGWKFHGSGWAIPIVDGYVVCQETVPALLDAWRSTQMNVVKMAAQERSDRALDNWRRLVRGLFLWRRVKAQFALAPLYPEALEAPRAKSVRKRPSRKSEQGAKSGSLLSDPNSLLNPDESKPDELGSLVMNAPLTDGDGWQRLACGENSHRLPIFPVSSNAPTLPQQKRPTKQSKARGPGSPSRGRSKGYGRQRKRAKSSTEEEDSETTPASSDTE
ncbi:DNA repair protein [Fasciola gigantica]|uniref:DNA repair protein n=1 Tax=Fasciola gigantica TaxID=46835 RepID=A0A504ZAS2_FASGI|nr:DNA repair protein [Fasciola gigantica]